MFVMNCSIYWTIYIYIYPELCLLRTVPYIGSTAVVEVPPDQAEFVTLQTILEVGIQLYP